MTTAATEIQTLTIGGQRLRVGIRRGDGTGGTPLLLFNGIGANLELLEPFTRALEGIETIAFDVPGAGNSPAPLLPYRLWQMARLAGRLLTQLGYTGPVDVLGVSWGGALAQQFALQNPARCRRLVLAATSPGVLMVPGKWSALKNLVSPRRYANPDFLGRVGPALYGGALRRNPDLLRRHQGHLRAPAGRGYFYQLMAGWGWSSLAWLPLLPQPTLVMAGSDDPIIPAVNAKLMATLIRRSQLHLIDDGHLFLVTRAAESAEAVRAFLRSPSPGSA